MRAIRVHEFGGPEVLQLETVTLPEPEPGEVVVQLKAAGVNPVDTYVRSALHARRSLPYTPGIEGAGLVSQVSPGGTWKVGQRVYLTGSLSGCYAEAALCREDQLRPLPDTVGFDQGAAVFVAYATAYRALFQRGGALPGERVLIHGASGGVGLAAVQLARAAGLKVLGTASCQTGRDLVLSQGAHAALDHGQSQAALDWSDGKGFDVVVEMLANRNLDLDLDLLSPNGRVVVVGNRGRVEIDARKTMARDADIRGMSLFNTPPAAMTTILAALEAGLENGTLRPVVGQRFALGQAAEAQIAVIEGHGPPGKIVLLTDS